MYNYDLLQHATNLIFFLKTYKPINPYKKVKFLFSILSLILISGLVPFVFAQSSEENEEVTLLGTPRIINNVGQEYDEEGEGVDVEYTLEGILLSNVEINQQEKTVTFFYDSQGINEDVLMIMLPDSLIDLPLMVLVDWVKEPEAIQSIRGDITTYYVPLYKENQRITFLGTEVISKRPFGGGCLIATATYGSELSPEVQKLRELRDNKILQTNSGTSFLNGFNYFYYSFSPVVADYERENPLFKEAVKLTITPMISSLSILNYVDMETDAEILGYGISLILLNIGMYIGIPAIVIISARRK